ncbi:hypothetical protein QZH56_00875 [Streptomyces olivoreticuli]|uniref:hypothetical protein n=1 Tax=Streptomyces olivoreticuli TaxID=68246 RepID=UPI0026585E5B|nr:hypothetical protein [Streptomyces olivoreticuli]WKK24260.1 hypothetical protein QZH56_00875 [Streptomyces olivoreticuli]
MASDLQELVTARLAELGTPGRPLSHRAAASRSQGHISHATIGRIARGEHTGTLEEETLDGLALALSLSRTDIEEAAGIYRERPAEPFVLPPRASRLTRREREAVLSVVEALLAAAEHGRPTQHRHPLAAPEKYDLVAYSPDGSGRISQMDLEVIRLHQEEEQRRNREGRDSQ